MISGNEKLVIGGSTMSSSFFENIIELSGKQKPNILVDTSPKASVTSYQKMKDTLPDALSKFSHSLTWLYPTFTKMPAKSTAKEKIETADILLISGGSTRLAVERWKKIGLIDKVLKRVSEGSLVGSGASSGAMIWFEKGYSDSNQYDVPEGAYWDYSMVSGVGLLTGWVTAHHSDNDVFDRLRNQYFKQELEENPTEWKTALGIDSSSALLVCNGLAKVLDTKLSTSKPDAPNSIYLYKNSGELEINELKPGNFISLTELFS